MNPLEQFTAYQYFKLMTIPFIGVVLNEITPESTADIYCSECGSKSVWETVRNPQHLPLFDEDTGDRFIYDALVCPRKKFAWKSWRVGFQTPCRLMLMFRRSSLKRSV